MFNLVEKNPKLVKGIMIAVAATFVLWGVGGYLGMTGDDGYVAKVGSNKIYPRDIEQVLQQNPQATDKMQILFSLINRQLLINNINDYHLIATKPQLQQEIAKIPAFQESGSFNLQKYQNFLRDRFLSAEQFQNTVQQQILINQLLDFFKGSYFSSTLFNQKFAQLLSWQRNVARYTINPEQFYPQIKLNEQQIKNYYQQNLAKFTQPEQAKLQFIELDTAAIANKVQLTEKEINNYLQKHQAQVAGPQINVSHILFTVPANADAKTRASIKAQAVKVLALAKANPSQFAHLATKYSEDPGSVHQGGNLGFFGRGVMVKPFEEAAFSL
ncbi:MAG: SurA N-terminal domain-containing protein, partial [Burkholderiales bacterium]